MKLKYLFHVVYEDGSEFRQNPEDVSATDPKRSAFFDVVNSGKKIKRFTISDNDNSYTVDLIDGLFYWNGKLLIVGDRMLLGPMDRRLIYYRDRLEQQSVTYDSQTGKVVQSDVVAAPVSYHIGWQGQDRGGRNVKQIIGVI